MAVVTTNLGAVTAYADAVAGGYTGTKAEWQALMASYGSVAEQAAESASQAADSASAASEKASEATTAASNAATAKADAETAKNAAETAQGKAETAQGAAEEAAESVSASAAQIATNTSDISELKSDLQNVENKTGLIVDVIDGYALTADGNVISNSNYKIVSFMPDSETIKIKTEGVSSTSTIRIQAFKNGVFVEQVYSAVIGNTTTTVTYGDYGNAVIRVSYQKTADISILTPTRNNLINKLSQVAEIVALADYDLATETGTLEGYSLTETNGLAENADYEIISYYAVSETQSIKFIAKKAMTLRLYAFNTKTMRIDQLVIQTFSAADSTVSTVNVNYADYKYAVFKLSVRKETIFTQFIKKEKTIDEIVSDVNSKAYLIDTYLNTGKMQFCAHRGARLEAPENSIPAFEIAGQHGFDWLNLAQLRQSADGTWYVLHDASIDRTTDGTGNIASLSDQYIQTVHIDTGANVEEYSADELVIPTFEKAIQIARKYGMKIYARIGAVPSDWTSFIAIVKKYRCEGMIFGGNSLSDVLYLAKNGMCVNWDVYSQENAEAQIQTYVDAGIKNATLFMPYTLITSTIVEHARSANLKVMVFDPNATGADLTQADAEAMSDLGVDIISSAVKYDV